ncbi:MAG: phosphodiester glycosidase family protein [Firmicutes bacterium]|nr:phosphodiester glycosidase family protein [Bacillota bacterium]
MGPITGNTYIYNTTAPTEAAPYKNEQEAPDIQGQPEYIPQPGVPEFETTDRVTVAPGIVYQEGAFHGTPYHLVKIETKTAGVALKPYLTGKPSGEAVLGMDQKSNSVATINGTFFDTTHPGKTIYGEVKTDSAEYHPTMIKKRTYWAVKPDGCFEMGETSPAGRDPEGRTLYQIPKEKWDSFKYILGGGGRLIDDGKKTSEGAGVNDEQFMSDILARRNRSALGYNENSFWMVSCDPPGWTPKETADFFLTLGANEAMFLDGGGSTEMIVRDKIVTKLSADAERLMPTSVIAVPRKGEAAENQA